MSDTQTSRCGFAAIVGAPNAGKSTLLNRLTGAKLSIVSPKAQTTRFRVLGTLMREASQILLVDTPGIFAPKRKLDRAMVKAAWSGAADADITVLLVDARTGATEAVQAIARQIASQNRRTWLVLNKIDLIAAHTLLPLTATLSAILPCEETFMVSAATGGGLDRMLDALAAGMPAGPTCRTGCWRRRSCASRSSSKSMRKSLMAARWRLRTGRRSRTGPSGWRRQFMSAGLGTRPS